MNGTFQFSIVSLKNQQTETALFGKLESVAVSLAWYIFYMPLSSKQENLLIKSQKLTLKQSFQSLSGT